MLGSAVLAISPSRTAIVTATASAMYATRRRGSGSPSGCSETTLGSAGLRERLLGVIRTA